ncbi:carboxylesterase family protein [Gammaproteobacteria bacterium]|jgi:para-nitrobenzyl esterase|nr:carboxylesterase family protein [Gammaproteobacteria bacterium]|tara:strand:- start:4520 stop:6373 length:1854 start_codon:yes stop_codon:yes gene_type:complete
MNQKSLINKKSFLVLIAGVFLFSCAGMNATKDTRPINTSTGVIKGLVKNQVISWEDIPYAQPPVGDLRWRAPRPFEDQDRAILAKDNNGCLQEPSIYAGIQGEGIVGQEDCLYLDIQAPENSLNNSLPVMFWIHGGGNTSGVKDYYDFSALVEEYQVIIVKINYRLGPMGWFTHPGIQDFATGMDKSSNFGTLDIIEALRWVKKNIASFGGNPENVTIFGESAGGHNVLTLLASPASNGLFHKAISQSGYTSSFTIMEASGAESEGKPLNALSSNTVLNQHNPSLYPKIKSLYLSNPEKNKDQFQKYLRSIDGKELLLTYKLIADDTFDRLPLVTRDGLVIPLKGIQAGLADPENNKNVPVIAGSNKDELSLWLGANRYFVNATFPLTKYIPIPKVDFKKPDLYKLWVKTRSEGWKLRGVDEPLMALEKAGYKSLYSYRFDWDDQKKSFFADFPSLIGAAHGFEISFITGDFRFGPIGRYVYPKGEFRDQMQSTMMNAWVSFARNGLPDTGKAVSWKKFNSVERSFIKLDKDKFLAMEQDNLSIQNILEDIKLASVGTLLEKCLLARETIENIGDPLEEEYSKWNQGACNQFDVNIERQKIENELIAQYGSVSVYGD